MASIESSISSLSRSIGRNFLSSWSRPATVLGCVALWVLALREIDLSRMNDFGLISVLSPFDFVALFILTASFCISVRDDSVRDSVLLLHVLALIFMLFGVTSIIEQVPRFESTWKHVGVADYVIRHGSVDPGIDAYFNWPGFFILLGYLTEITGAKSPMTFANWAPVALELLYLPPLMMIFRRATSDRRLIWLAVWTFYVANWIGQDYLSPQGFNFFLYLVIVAILVNWFSVSSDQPHPLIRMATRLKLPTGNLSQLYKWAAPADMPSGRTERWQRIILVAVIIGLFVVITAGHQLTPFAVLGATALLVLSYRCNLVGMPLVMAAIAALWLRFGASAYWAGHGSQITSGVGNLNQSVGTNMTDRLSGSRGHEIVVYIRTAMTLALWVLAGIGCLRRISRGHRDFTFAILAVAPFPLIAAQSYGGEMLLRVYLFSLPFMAFFVAAMFYRSEEVGGSWKTTLTIMALSIFALTLFFVTRYGNERQDYFTPNEVKASEAIYDNAPPGSVILAGTVKTPWKHRDYELHKHKTLADDVEWHDPTSMQADLEQIADILKDPDYNGGFLIITRSQIANAEMFGLLPFDLTQLEQALRDSPEFRIYDENSDAIVFVLADQKTSGP